MLVEHVAEQQPEVEHEPEVVVEHIAEHEPEVADSIEVEESPDELVAESEPVVEAEVVG